jgi:tRNA(fMet)-specific endonuclease VapC
MKYLLDTNICIAWLQGKDHELRDKIIRSRAENLVICSIVKAELLYGAKKSQSRNKNEMRLRAFFSQILSLPFDDESAEQYGIIRATLEQTGANIGANDMMIAAVALQHHLTIVTRNCREFERLASIQVVSW